MPVSWIIILVVGLAETGAGHTNAMVQTASEALGDRATIQLAEAPKESLDPNEIQVRVTWDESHTVALMNVQGAGRDLSRRVAFSEADADNERGRTLGFVLASMLPEQLVRAPTSSAGPTTTEERFGYIEASGLFSLAPSEDSSVLSFGGSVAGAWFPIPMLGLRLGLAARAGDLAEAQANALWMSATTGAILAFARPKAGFPLELDIWVAGGIMRQSATHYSADDASPVTQSQWLPVMEGHIDIGWAVTSDLELLLGGGLEAALGKVDIFVADERRASLEPFRILFNLGFRVGI